MVITRKKSWPLLKTIISLPFVAIDMIGMAVVLISTCAPFSLSPIPYRLFFASAGFPQPVKHARIPRVWVKVVHLRLPDDEERRPPVSGGIQIGD